MGNEIKIKCLNTGQSEAVPSGKTLYEIAEIFKLKKRESFFGALVNNKLQELRFEVFRPKSIQFIDGTHPDGKRIFMRSLSFVLLKATKDIFPEAILKIEHSVSKGLYCELEGVKDGNTIESVLKIGERMREIAAADIPFLHEEIETTEAISLFEDNGFCEKAKLFKTRPQLYTSVYYLEDQIDYFYGSLLPSTGYLKTFDLVKYYDGMLLMFPRPEKPDELQELILQDKMFDIFREHKHWMSILNAGTIGSINNAIAKNEIEELIKISEALHEKKLAHIADSIYDNRDKTRIVLISGPSSSGKTTFSKRLSVQLKVLGLKPVNISLDDYFVDRELTPRDKNGEYDFESLDAIDIKLFNKHLVDLLKGKEIELPKFSFELGKREYHGDTLQITNDNILVIEGIHGLNPRLTEKIQADAKFKIYISALTTLSMDGHNRIPTTDTRLIRRIVRDHKFRNYSAFDTIARWQSVRRGEEKHIFPYQEEADVMFNSAMLFELGVLKSFVEPLLKEVNPTVPEYAEAQRLLKFTAYLSPIPYEMVPNNSILREFLGGSSFKY